MLNKGVDEVLFKDGVAWGIKTGNEVRKYVCTYVCMYVFVRTSVCMYVFVRMYVCTYYDRRIKLYFFGMGVVVHTCIRVVTNK